MPSTFEPLALLQPWTQFLFVETTEPNSRARYTIRKFFGFLSSWLSAQFDLSSNPNCSWSNKQFGGQGKFNTCCLASLFTMSTNRGPFLDRFYDPIPCTLSSTHPCRKHTVRDLTLLCYYLFTEKPELQMQLMNSLCLAETNPLTLL